MTGRALRAGHRFFVLAARKSERSEAGGVSGGETGRGRFGVFSIALLPNVLARTPCE